MIETAAIFIFGPNVWPAGIAFMFFILLLFAAERILR